jgi:hypothetical protein
MNRHAGFVLCPMRIATALLYQLVECNGYKLYLVSDYAPSCGKSKTRLAANMAILN